MNTTNDNPAGTYLLAHITDLHIKAGGKLSYRMVDTAGALRRCIASLLAAPQQPDAVVITGDLVDFGTEEEYRFLHAHPATPPMPVRLLPGNHDHRASLRRGLPITITCSPTATATRRFTTAWRPGHYARWPSTARCRESRAARSIPPRRGSRPRSRPSLAGPRC